MGVITELSPVHFKAPVNFWHDVRFWAANGPVMQAAGLCTAMTGMSVATGAITPAGSLIIGVTVRVQTAITGATGFKVGDGTDADRWAANVGTAVGSTNSVANFTDLYPRYATGTLNVWLTANGSAFTAGEVKVLAYYIYLAAPAP